MSDKQPEEVIVDEIPDAESLYDCTNCGESFYAPEGEYICPFCGEHDLVEA